MQLDLVVVVEMEVRCGVLVFDFVILYLDGSRIVVSEDMVPMFLVYVVFVE